MTVCIYSKLFLLPPQADNRKRYKEEANDHLDDQSAADLAWEKHKLLNESVIVALFQGQFKSTVQCLTCHRKSRTFETFMYLSLPLASSNRCSLQVSTKGLHCHISSHLPPLPHTPPPSLSLSLSHILTCTHSSLPPCLSSSLPFPTFT